MGVMRCPANHAANDSAEEVSFIREWAAATSWDSIHEILLAAGHCPACPGTERLQPETRELLGRQHSTGRCPCCTAVWITDDARSGPCLDTGKLICTHED
ncbi:MAG: hypothetical protein ACM4D3_10895 [Candidatus Sericytochromatia bacterium]